MGVLAMVGTGRFIFGGGQIIGQQRDFTERRQSARRRECPCKRQRAVNEGGGTKLQLNILEG